MATTDNVKIRAGVFVVMYSHSLVPICCVTSTVCCETERVCSKINVKEELHQRSSERKERERKTVKKFCRFSNLQNFFTVLYILKTVLSKTSMKCSDET